MLSWSAARQVAHESGPVLAPEDIALSSAVGRRLAATLTAAVDSPTSDRSAMDGFAVAGEPPWRVVGRILAGDDEVLSLVPGQAVEIATGAVPPRGTIGVLPYETAQVVEGWVRGECAAGANIRRRGEEFQAREGLVLSNTVLGPVHVGLAAAMGLDVVTVRRAAAVSAVITGAEVVTRGRPRRHEVRDAIGPMLPGMVRSVGAHFTGLVHVGDDPRRLESWLDRDDDVVLVIGASSAGPTDFLASTLERLGGQNLVRSVACRPGHPQSLWRLGTSFIAGLPGNPLAALSAFVTLVAPIVDGMHGQPLAPVAPVPAAHAAVEHRGPSFGGRTVLTPARWEAGLLAGSHHGGAAMLRGAASADGFAVTRPGDHGIGGFLAFPWSRPGHVAAVDTPRAHRGR